MTRARLLWHVVLAPLAGAAGGAALYGMAVRPILTWPAWVLDVIGVLCGAGGLLAGGVLGFLPVRAPGAVRMNRRPIRARRWLPIGVAGSSMAAVASAVLLAGVPGVTWPAVVAGAAGGAMVCLIAGRLVGR